MRRLYVLGFLLSVFLICTCSCGLTSSEEETTLVKTSCGEYEQLTDYGLTESMINDDSETELLEEKAIKLSNQNN